MTTTYDPLAGTVYRHPGLTGTARTAAVWRHAHPGTDTYPLPSGYAARVPVPAVTR
jgi:hypothetical protein